MGDLIFDKDNQGNIVRKCQLCNSGTLSLKNSFRGGAFIGCSNYPECKFTRPLSKSKAAAQAQLAEPKFIGKHENGNDIYLKNGRFGPYLQYEKIPSDIEVEKISKKKKKTKKLKSDATAVILTFFTEPLTTIIPQFIPVFFLAAFNLSLYDFESVQFNGSSFGIGVLNIS